MFPVFALLDDGEVMLLIDEADVARSIEPWQLEPGNGILAMCACDGSDVVGQVTQTTPPPSFWQRLLRGDPGECVTVQPGPDVRPNPGRLIDWLAALEEHLGHDDPEALVSRALEWKRIGKPIYKSSRTFP